jgi:hypothetical protein
VCSLFEESPCGDKKGINKNPFSRSLSKYNNSKKKDSKITQKNIIINKKNKQKISIFYPQKTNTQKRQQQQK